MAMLGGILERIARGLFEGPLGVLSRFFRHDYNVVDVVYQRAVIRSAEIVEKRMSSAMVCRSKTELWQTAIGHAKTRDCWLEFGVFKGRSINFLAKECETIYGFDSFLGLEEDWVGSTFRAGSFSLRGKLPKVKSNVKLVKGFFKDTLPHFINENSQVEIGLIHLDCDTYESTKFVLELLGEYINKDTVIIIDDYFGAPCFEQGQFRAIEEFSTDNRKKLEIVYIAYSRQSVALRLVMKPQV